MRKRFALKPDEVVAQIRKRIRDIFGDAKENRTRVWASHGYYYIEFKKKYPVIIRRGEVVNYFKALAASEKGRTDTNA
jgi:hypothetical protein